MTAKLGFIASISSTGSAPLEFQIFPYGSIEIKGSSPFVVDEAAMDQVIRQFQARNLDMVIDYEHQTLGKTDVADFSSPDGKAPAAGWIKALENRGKDGLWAKVEWTDKAKEYLANREYRYYSPVFNVSKASGKLTELLTVALTNTPRLNSIQPIVAKNPANGGTNLMKRMIKMLGLAEAATEDQVIEAMRKMMDGSKTTAKELGLAESATEEQVVAAIKTLKQPAQIVACKDVLDALGVAESASKSEIVASIHALKQRPDATVIQEIASLKARLAERDRDELVAAAIKAGKITPAQKEWAEKYALADAEGFKLFVAKAPVVVPLDKVPILPDGKSNSVPDDTQLQINKLMGIDDDTFKKYGPKQAA